MSDNRRRDLVTAISHMVRALLLMAAHWSNTMATNLDQTTADGRYISPSACRTVKIQLLNLVSILHIASKNVRDWILSFATVNTLRKFAQNRSLKSFHTLHELLAHICLESDTSYHLELARAEDIRLLLLVSNSSPHFRVLTSFVISYNYRKYRQSLTQINFSISFGKLKQIFCKSSINY